MAIESSSTAAEGHLLASEESLAEDGAKGKVMSALSLLAVDTAFENSEVSPVALFVAVVVICSPTETACSGVKGKLKETGFGLGSALAIGDPRGGVNT